MKKESSGGNLKRVLINGFGVTVFAVLILGPFFGSSTGDGISARRSAAMQTVKAIGFCLYTYAQDHQGHYPEGRTSTEVFQQLIDQGYVTDPNVFYLEFLHIPGKARPQGTKLKPENVCFDVICCVDSSAPDNLPVVYTTGYRVSYEKGGSCKLLSPYPKRTWVQFFKGDRSWKPFVAVGYKGNNATSVAAAEDGSVPGFFAADFDPKGKVYRQLTP